MRLMSVLMVMAIVMVSIFYSTQKVVGGGGGGWYYSPQTGQSGLVDYQDTDDVGYLTSTGFTRRIFYQIMDASRRPPIDLSNDPTDDCPQKDDGSPSKGEGDGTKDDLAHEGVPQMMLSPSVRQEIDRRFQRSRAPILGFPAGESSGYGPQLTEVQFPVNESIGSSPSLSGTGMMACPQVPGSSYQESQPSYQLPEPWYQLQ